MNKTVEMDTEKLKKPIKYTLCYLSGFIFFITLIMYMYMLIQDYIENEKHTAEETAWIYGMLIVLILGFCVSFYLISEESQIKLKKSLVK
jgi:predicted membrane channel-forming protein YqfA (hemolysin III family)